MNSLKVSTRKQLHNNCLVYRIYVHKQEPVVFPLKGYDWLFYIEEERNMKKSNEVQAVKQEEKKRGCAESKGICKMCKVCRGIATHPSS